MILKKSTATNRCLALLTHLSIEANSVDPYQTAPFRSGSTPLVQETSGITDCICCDLHFMGLMQLRNTILNIFCRFEGTSYFALAIGLSAAGFIIVSAAVVSLCRVHYKRRKRRNNMSDMATAVAIEDGEFQISL